MIGALVILTALSSLELQVINPDRPPTVPIIPYAAAEDIANRLLRQLGTAAKVDPKQAIAMDVYAGQPMWIFGTDQGWSVKLWADDGTPIDVKSPGIPLVKGMVTPEHVPSRFDDDEVAKAHARKHLAGLGHAGRPFSFARFGTPRQFTDLERFEVRMLLKTPPTREMVVLTFEQATGRLIEAQWCYDRSRKSRLVDPVRANEIPPAKSKAKAKEGGGKRRTKARGGG